MSSGRVNLSFLYKIVDIILHSANHIRFTMDDEISSEISLSMQSRAWKLCSMHARELHRDSGSVSVSGGPSRRGGLDSSAFSAAFRLTQSRARQ
jgi:hypothetical protein